MIKYFGSPLLPIRSKLTGHIIFTFDSKGEFFTDDKLIIARAEGFFDSIEMQYVEKGKKIKKTFYNPPITIVKNKVEKEA